MSDAKMVNNGGDPGGDDGGDKLFLICLTNNTVTKKADVINCHDRMAVSRLFHLSYL